MLPIEWLLESLGWSCLISKAFHAWTATGDNKADAHGDVLKWSWVPLPTCTMPPRLPKFSDCVTILNGSADSFTVVRAFNMLHIVVMVSKDGTLWVHTSCTSTTGKADWPCKLSQVCGKCNQFPCFFSVYTWVQSEHYSAMASCLDLTTCKTDLRLSIRIQKACPNSGNNMKRPTVSSWLVRLSSSWIWIHMVSGGCWFVTNHYLTIHIPLKSPL